jgi:NAD(P)-dependent dehydrogenase (short-subunit alcohol dehydrogenase family)
VLLKDRVALVSGIGPGLGKEIALALARAGADVALGARTEERLRETAAEIEGLGRRAHYLPTDVTQPDQRQALVDSTMEALGRVDVLVNNAFIQPPFKRIEFETEEMFRRAFEVNVLGGLGMARAVIPAMKAQGGGSIVFINTMSIRTSEVKTGAYAASKSALFGAAKVLAREHGGDGIRVNSIMPGYIWGPNLEWYFNHLAEKEGITSEQVYERVAAETALRHLPTSAEVADAVVFFASDLSRVITGQSLDVNGGHWFE